MKRAETRFALAVCIIAALSGFGGATGCGRSSVSKQPVQESGAPSPALERENKRAAAGEDRSTSAGSDHAERTPDASGDPREAASAEGVREAISSLDRTVWSKEVEAQEYEQSIVAFWDRLRTESDRWQALASFSFAKITLGTFGEVSQLDWDIGVTKSGPGGETLTHAEWTQLLEKQRAAGWQIVESEWHHAEFDHPDNAPSTSTVSFKLLAEQVSSATRHTVVGKLRIIWSGRRDPAGNWLAEQVSIQDVTVQTRRGAPAFTEAMVIDPREIGDAPRVAVGTIVYDVDHDALPEIVLCGCNRLLRNRGDFKFEPEKLVDFDQYGFSIGQIADFTGDGRVDLLAVRAKWGVYVFPGVAGGRFSHVPLKAENVAADLLVRPTSLTAGDVDRDGDLDVWLGQWKDPYDGASPPATYYDAQDSYESFLLVNDGTGRLSDGTGSAGMEDHRRRRTFSSSFIDLDADGDLDLLTVSDFAGVDIYRNDGHGVFTAATDELIDVRYNFGMSHTFGDYDRDGALDLFVIGMSSTTARRLDYMRLGPAHRSDVTQMRSTMGYGNRMYLSHGGRFEQAAFNDDVARSGWSWGSTTIDFDSDGDEDVHVANGFMSRHTARDYCTRFWCHDIYLGAEQPKPAVQEYFRELSSFKDYSWNPFEKDCLFMNVQGTGFVEVAHLMGCALAFDGRQVIGADLNADGRPDLIVGEVVAPEREPRELLHVLRNSFPTDESHRWIGIHMDDRIAGVSPIGARIELLTNLGRRAAAIVTGDSVWSQHPVSKHFGLAADENVERLLVTWPNGHTWQLDEPSPNQYYSVSPSLAAAAPSSTASP